MPRIPKSAWKLVLIPLIVVGVISLYSASKLSSRMLVVLTEPITRKDFAMQISSTGFLDLGERVNLQSPSAAVVLESHFEEGEHVEKGDVLVQLLVAQDEIAIRAPFSGTILRKGDLLKRGAILKEGDLAVELGSTESPIVRCDIDQADFSNVRVGYYARITSDALIDQEFRGSVQSVAPAVKDTQGGLKIPVVIDLFGKTNLPFGSRVNVRITPPVRRNVYSVPIQAIAYNSPQPVVFVLRNGKVVLLPVRTGVSNGAEVEVVFLGKIHPGDQVITSPVDQLHEGRAVQKAKT